MTSQEKLSRRIDASLGKIPCDRVLKDVTYLDVFTSTWKKSDIGFIDGFIVATDSGVKGVEEVRGQGLFAVPGFIDAHVHVESSLLTPAHFDTAVLPRGTTTAICDPHELTNVLGKSALQYFLSESEKLRMDLKVMLSSCVPATQMETNGGGTLCASDLLPFKSHSQALGLAEMMNVPGVLFKDPEVLQKLESFFDRPIDGHSPLLRGRELSAYLSTGISSCHESSQLEEAAEKISKGMSVWIREGSVAKDLAALIPLLTVATSPSIGFCTDDRNPLDIHEEGHVDFLVKKAIAAGVAPEIAYRSASWSVACHYGLNRGSDRRGAIAPGFLADMVLLADTKVCAIDRVFRKGKLVTEGEFQKEVGTFGNTVRAHTPTPQELEGPKGNVHVIVVEPGKIITDRAVLDSSSEGVAKLSVLERYGHGSKPSNGYVLGFGKSFRGAIASSVGHDSHNLIVVGQNTEDMQVALKSLIECGGGFSVVQGKKVIANLALPFGGLMTAEPAEVVVKKLKELRKASREVGCEMKEPFLQLAFLSLPVIPKLKLTDKGLVDVEAFKVIGVRA